MKICYITKRGLIMKLTEEQNNQKIQRKFWAAQRFAEFNRKEELINLLKMRENKYLKDD